MSETTWQVTPNNNTILADGIRYRVPPGPYTLDEFVAILNEQAPYWMEWFAVDGKGYSYRLRDVTVTLEKS